ncbi:MAG: class I SAM-dependent methyltransferase [Bacteroidales bacterium]|nr:class I SAM-dependent methyltransferase [Bacteroidales bacterium]
MNRALFRKDIQESNNGIWEVTDLPSGNYDAQAVQYDKLISNGLYNRIMWKNKPSDYADFHRVNLEKSKPGTIADIGCGTLGFTSEVYAQYRKQEVYFCDFSYEMLKLGRQKLLKLDGSLYNYHFLRTDALDMPFSDGSLQTVLSYGLLHIFEESDQLLTEFYRMLLPGGDLHMTVLCKDRKFSGRYLNLLHKKGHVAKPMFSDQILNKIKDSNFTIRYSLVKGGMLYVSAQK